jgi:dolichol-phosphate mannosyltransferase
MNQKTLVVLPVYNEALNIVELVESIMETNSNTCICVVDDSSPDGTAEIVRKKIHKSESWANSVQIICRPQKSGRGSAVRLGFELGFKSTDCFAAFVEMDCDFSHDPKAISTGLALLAKGNDLVIGSRYPNGSVVGCTLPRRVFSKSANIFARALISPKISDYTNGFRFYNRRALGYLLQQPQKTQGFISLSETLATLLSAKMQIASFPTTFKNRVRGSSNLSLREIMQAFYDILIIAWHYRRSTGTLS